MSKGSILLLRSILANGFLPPVVKKRWWFEPVEGKRNTNKNTFWLARNGLETCIKNPDRNIDYLFLLLTAQAVEHVNQKSWALSVNKHKNTFNDAKRKVLLAHPLNIWFFTSINSTVADLVRPWFLFQHVSSAQGLDFPGLLSGVEESGPHVLGGPHGTQQSQDIVV